jgi:hypothetical protein
MLLTPDPQLPQDWAEIAAGRSEHVLVPGRVRAVAAALHETGVLKFAKPRGKAGSRCGYLLALRLVRFSRHGARRPTPFPSYRARRPRRQAGRRAAARR